jgi:hypothetical protein
MDPMGMALECMLARSDTTIFMNELESCGCKRTRFCSESVWPPQFLPRTAEIHFRHHKNCREAFFFQSMVEIFATPDIRKWPWPSEKAETLRLLCPLPAPPCWQDPLRWRWWRFLLIPKLPTSSPPRFTSWVKWNPSGNSWGETENFHHLLPSFQDVLHISTVSLFQTCSLQTLGLPAANPGYPLTCSNPCVRFKLFTFQNNKP